MSERRRGVLNALTRYDILLNEKVPAIESRPDDPADWDELITAARVVVRRHTNGLGEVHPETVLRLSKALQLKQPAEPRK